ncbi:hypothetical protein B566_EDAN005018 [Ephemera danica]|nr:hypothetical protein B566_EDAN005018 [Ephemera danica]
MAAPEDVVISGMSGRFPDCDNVHEFKENLYNKVDMMTSDLGSRWQLGHPEMPKRGGFLRNLNKFDASFFASHGFGVVGCSRALIANRISYWLDIHGPSYSVDSACSSSMYALDHALRAMRTGQCEAALVGGVNLTLHPYLTMQFARLGVLSLDGKCKSFDDTGPSYSVDSACSSSMYALDHALRAMRTGQCEAALVGGVNLTLHPYLTMQFARLGVLSRDGKCKSFDDTVVHTKANQDGYKEQGITFPSGHMQYELLTQCYKECGITPSDIKFVEAHGTGTNVYYQEAIAAGGVQIVGLRASLIARRKNMAETVMESYSPLKYFNDTPVSLSTALRAMVHIVLENLPLGKMNIVEWADINVVGAGLELTEKLSKSGQQLNVQNHLTSANVDLALYGDDNSMLAMNKVSVDAVRSVCVGGFVIVRSDSENNGDVLRFLQEVGLKLVSKMQVVNAINSNNENKCENPEMTFLLLARKVEEQAGTNVVIQVNEESNLVPEFCWLSQLQNVLTANIAPERIYLVSQYSSCTGLLGLVNCLRMETHYNIRAVLILDESAPQFNVMDPFYKSQLQHDLLMNVLMPNGRGWASYRHLPITPIAAKVTHAFVEQSVRGDLSSFRWCQGPLSSRTETTMGDQLQLYSIYAASLNFRDVMIATGKLTTEVATSSRFTERKRVMGIVNSGAQANLVQADPLLVWELPTEWTLEAAATVPVVYCTAYYALVVRGQMRNGESVLIHSGTGGVGQAAVNIALYLGCTVYVTVGSAEKRSFLHKMFPQIPDANIGTSRDTSFEQLVKERTKGKGVDLVLNSLAGDKLQASLRCLKMHGRFLEIGKVDINADSPLGMIIFQKDIAIHGVLLDAIIDGTSGEKRNLHDILSQGIKSGAVKPLARQVFGVNEIEGAYRFMASGNHIGKILIRIREEERNELVCPEQRLVDAVSRFYCDPHKSYVIVGGLGGFGLELADWLVLRGARKLVLSTRSGVTNGYQAFRLRVWDNYGVSVKISQADVTCEQGCINLLESAVTMLGPVDAIFNLAVVLRDAIFENQNLESFTVSFMPKARATHLLDEVSRRLCPTLRQFVVFSSVCCGHGNAGQTNYGVANSVMERICEKRRLQGFPALAVQWGAVGDVGLLVKQVAGTLQQSISSCLETLDLFLTMADSYTVLSSMVVAEKDRSSDNVLDAVANILGIKDVKTVSHHSTLAELGMDSMMAVEIKQTLEREFQMVFSPQDIRALTFAKLEEHEKQN